MATARVLLVDDEEAFATVVADRLRARGIDVDLAHDGETGIKKAAARTYDAILLDLAMPGGRFCREAGGYRRADEQARRRPTETSGVVRRECLEEDERSASQARLVAGGTARASL